MDFSGKETSDKEDVPDLQNIVLKSTKGSIKTGNFSVKYESEKMNQSKNFTEQPSLSKYFSQPSSSSLSSAASFFDQISSSSNGSAMMTSVRESSSSQDLFAASSGLEKLSITGTNLGSFQPYSPAPQPPARASRAKNNVTEQEKKEHITGDQVAASSANNKVEPSVCRIFASSEAPTEIKLASNEIFFDMLGGSAGSKPPHSYGSQMTDVTIPNSSQRDSTISVPVDFSSSEASFLPGLDTSLTVANDSFTSILNEEGVNKSSMYPSEADRRRDAWIPSESTRLALMTAATSPPGTYFPEKSLLTMPGVALEEELVDTVHGIVKYFLGDVEVSKRKVLTSNDVTQDERGLRELIQAGCYRAAINLTGRLLTMYGQGVGRAGHPSKHTVNSLQLWFTRISLHVKLRTFSLAEVEAGPFGNLDQPDLYFQFYPELYGGRVGSMVPFSFRLLVAELPQYSMKYQEALNRLHVLLATVRKIISNLTSGLSEDGSPAKLSDYDCSESKKLWISREARVLHSIVNCALYQKFIWHCTKCSRVAVTYLSHIGSAWVQFPVSAIPDYNLAVEVLELLLSKHEWSINQTIALQSALGRVYLQLGDVVGAERNFALVRDIRQQQSGSATAYPPPDLRELIDRGLMAVAQNAFQEAYECFQKASKLDPGNIMLLNNMGVCLLYLGRLKEALGLLEEAVNSNPARGLHESLLLNVCTLYELEGAHSNHKKLNMLKLISKYKGDGVNLGCLKLQS